MNREQRRKLEKIIEMMKKDEEMRNKYPWVIHAVYDPDNPDKPIDYHTHGLDKYGLKELCMEHVGKEFGNTCRDIINYVAAAMVDGEKFDVNFRHYVDDEDGKLIHAFDLADVTNKEGEELIYIDYLFETEYQYPADHHVYVFNEFSGKWVRVDELVWDSFGREPRNGRDIVHIDGDETNNAIDNLKLA